MKRQLTEEERNQTVKGIDKLKKELEDINESFTMQSEGYNFWVRKCVFEDKIKPYNRKQEEKTYKDNMNALDERAKQVKYAISEMRNQLTNGVEKKEAK